jgi:ubiquinone/menaquinone biosynthesis C-methylase UbiE
MSSPLINIKFNRRTMVKVLTKVRTILKNKEIVYLDMGSGECSTTEFVVNVLKPKRVICVDIDERLLNRCHEKGFEVLQADLNTESLPLENDNVDFVTPFEVIEHLWNKDNMLREAYRILKQQGLFMLSTPNLAAWANRLLLLLGKTPYYYDVSPEKPLTKYGYGHVNLYTLELLKKHLTYHKFEVIEVHGLLTPLYKHFKLLELVTLLIAKDQPSLAPDILILARKQ